MFSSVWQKPPLQQLPKGVHLDSVKKATRQPLEFSCKLSSSAGDVGEVKLLKDSVRVTCAASSRRRLYWTSPTGSVSQCQSQNPGVRLQQVIGRPTTLQKGMHQIWCFNQTVGIWQSETKAQSARRTVKWVTREQVRAQFYWVTWKPPRVCLHRIYEIYG